MKHSTLFTISILVLLLLGIIGVSGCGENSLTSPSDSGNSQRGFYKSSTMTSKSFKMSGYLTLSTYKLSKMSKKDLKKLNKALERVDIYKKNGLYHIKQASGAQVNISEQLYKYLKAGVANTNKYINPKALNYSPPHLISMSEGSEGGEQYRTDCAAVAVAHAGNVSLRDAEKYESNHYPKGVPSDSMSQFIHHFYKHAYKTGNPGASEDHSTILTFSTSSTTAHAVNGTGFDQKDLEIKYHDYQTGQASKIGVGDVRKQWVVPAEYQ